MGPLRDREVHADRLPVQLLAVHHLPGLGSVLHGVVVDEGEATAAAGVSIQNYLTLLDAPERAEVFLQLPLGGVQGQAEHSQALVGLRSFSLPTATTTTSVPSTTGRGRAIRVARLLCNQY